jgi:hypothetical protein
MASTAAVHAAPVLRALRALQRWGRPRGPRVLAQVNHLLTWSSINHHHWWLTIGYYEN